jgi:glycosyltransferase involved in cell wall biosynthesis
LKNAELHIYGRKDLNYYNLLKENKNIPNLYLHGLIKGTENLVKVYQNSDVFVFPSSWEGSAKVTYEAMACKLPVITTINAGSVLNNTKEGFIIKSENINELKDKIKFFYDNPEEIKKFGERGRNLAEKYSWERYSREIIKIYNKVNKN